MDIKVFFSWQSDTPAETGKDFITNALSTALGRIHADTEIDLRPDLDQDTQHVPGSPPMVATILEKVDKCAVFVADVSLTHVPTFGSGKLAPNPNVAFELGYAMHRLGFKRVLLVMNTEQGTPERLPFDLRGNRVIGYDPTQGEEHVANSLEKALRLILLDAGLPQDMRPPVELDIMRKDMRIAHDRHDYRLSVTAKNIGEVVVKDWAVEVQMPCKVLDARHHFPLVVSRTTPDRAVMRLTEQEHSGPIYPDDTKEIFGLDYHMDNDLWNERETLFASDVTVSFFMGDKRVSRMSKSFQMLQKF